MVKSNNLFWPRIFKKKILAPIKILKKQSFSLLNNHRTSFQLKSQLTKKLLQYLEAYYVARITDQVSRTRIKNRVALIAHNRAYLYKRYCLLKNSRFNYRTSYNRFQKRYPDWFVKRYHRVVYPRKYKVTKNYLRHIGLRKLRKKNLENFIFTHRVLRRQVYRETLFQYHWWKKGRGWLLDPKPWLRNKKWVAPHIWRKVPHAKKRILWPARKRQYTMKFNRQIGRHPWTDPNGTNFAAYLPENAFMADPRVKMKGSYLKKPVLTTEQKDALLRASSILNIDYGYQAKARVKIHKRIIRTRLIKVPGLKLIPKSDTETTIKVPFYPVRKPLPVFRYKSWITLLKQKRRKQKLIKYLFARVRPYTTFGFMKHARRTIVKILLHRRLVKFRRRKIKFKMRARRENLRKRIAPWNEPDLTKKEKDDDEKLMGEQDSTVLPPTKDPVVIPQPQKPVLNKNQRKTGGQLAENSAPSTKANRERNSGRLEKSSQTNKLSNEKRPWSNVSKQNYKPGQLDKARQVALPSSEEQSRRNGGSPVYRNARQITPNNPTNKWNNKSANTGVLQPIQNQPFNGIQQNNKHYPSIKSPRSSPSNAKWGRDLQQNKPKFQGHAGLKVAQKSPRFESQQSGIVQQGRVWNAVKAPLISIWPRFIYRSFSTRTQMFYSPSLLTFPYYTSFFAGLVCKATIIPTINKSWVGGSTMTQLSLNLKLARPSQKYLKIISKHRYGWYLNSHLVKIKWFRKRIKRWLLRYRKIKKHIAFAYILKRNFFFLTGLVEKNLQMHWNRWRRGNNKYWGGSVNLLSKFSNSVLLSPANILLLLNVVPSLTSARAVIKSGGLLINGQNRTLVLDFIKPGDLLQLNMSVLSNLQNQYNYHHWNSLNIYILQYPFLLVDWSLLLIAIIRWPTSYELIAPVFLTERWLRYYVRQFPVKAKYYKEYKYKI